jgi:signal transduction histidine kinase
VHLGTAQMTSPAHTLIGLTLVLAGLIGILIFVAIRLRTGATRASARPRDVSEEAFMATAIQQALAGRTAAAPSPAAPVTVPVRAVSIDTAIVTGLPLGILLVRKGGIVPRANPAAFRLLHLTAVPALPARVSDLALPAALTEVADRVLTSSQAAEVRLEVHTTEGASHVVGAAVSPMPVETGTPAGVVIVLTDLTDAERREALERRRESMAATARLASSLAHELANNLTGAHGYSRMIDASSLSAADRVSLEALQRETDALGETIEGFRRVTRPLDLTRERFPARWLVEDAARHVVAELQVASDAIAAHTPEGLEVEGDRILLEDALMHALRNAIEACTDAGIRPDVRVSAHAVARGAAVAIVVEDNGPGMNQPERAHLFEPFFSTKPGHAGLGLARAQHIVHSHDGTIEASHPDEHGLIVTMVLPIANPAHPTVAGR